MPTAQPTSVLLVDDEPHNIVALEAALTEVECHLVIAHSGREALKCVLAQDFAVIVLDIVMPDIDGFETATLIRGRDRSRLTPIIFLSADDPDPERILEGYRLGAVDYLDSPFDAAILCSKVSFFVELFRKTLALEQRTVELGTMASELERSEEHFRALIENASDLILIVESSGVIRYASPSMSRLLGYTQEQIDGCLISDFMHPDDVPSLDAGMAKLLKLGGTSPPSSRRWRHADGSYRVLESTASNQLGTMGVAGLLMHARDVTERNVADEQLRTLNNELERTRAEADLRRQAAHDGLTGLPNRVLLHERLEGAISGVGLEDRGCALLVLDLDRFKEVNDTLGHQVGDELLRQIGQRLVEGVLATDLVARLGGDEFAVLLPATNASRATRVADDLVRALQIPFVLEGQTIAVDASLGIAVAPQHGLDADTLFRHADVAMYQAKRLGTGVAMYAHSDDQHRPDRLALLGELRLASERDLLLLHYQPKLDLRTGALVGLEALVRWQHPQRGFLSPGEFIPLAELSGLIRSLSLWVLEAALRQQRSWRLGGLDVPVAVNLSRRMLHDPLLPDTVAQLLTRWNVPPSALVLEITESSLMADPEGAGENLKQLRVLGVHISIDDFGTGYSSLASLQNLLVDELKIDKSFVQAMATDASARAIVRAIIDLADALNLRVVAEGIEDRATWDVLASLGCDVAQGYFPSPPMAADVLEAWIVQVAPSWQELAGPPRTEDPLQERIRGRGARLTAEEEFIARKQSEAALRNSEERNRLALQAARMGTWERDVLHDVLTWSTETEALHGLPPGSFAGSSAALRLCVHPDDWASVAFEIEEARLERRETFATYRTIWPDGTVHWIETRGRALYAEDGSALRINGTSMDITPRKLAEEALQASEERFRNQYKGIPLPTYSYDQVGDDFVLQDFNDAADVITGGKIRDGLGKLASEWFADVPEILTDLRGCVAEQRGFRRETLYRFRTSGRVRELALSYVFVPPRTVMIHTEDITDAKNAEQQNKALAQSEKLRALGQMATGIAHDLNQSLMLVASYSDLARQALAADPPNLVELEDLLTTTTQAALDGGDTVKRLLLFTRAAPEHDSQAVDLSKVVRDAAQLTAPRWRDAAQAAGRPISLSLVVEGNPTVQGSWAQLRDLMTNVIFNAVDALPLGGAIGLRVVAEDGQGVIEISDSGVGMSAEVQERVFEPFFTTKGEGGTGMGLAMVFGIVEQHGGHIAVRSAPGEGTTFRITLPLMVASALDEPTTRAPAPLEPQAPLRILAVDDEPMMTRAVVRMLKPSGHVVSVAGSGEEALEKLAEQTFDVVVSDMGMGAGMNGWELVDEVKRRWPDVRFMLATGWGAAIDPARARASGVEAVLSKPYHPAELLEVLARTDRVAAPD
jgi:diguanylate cyclase (GGDEF)-like protein/PAS domain S-box-containing protein